MAVRILVVDDEQDHAEAMGEALTRVGYGVETATSGEEAQEVLQERDFDIVITDLVMGEVSGFEVLKAALEAVPDIEVIVVSAKGGIEAAVEAMKQGAATFLEKPLNIEAVRQVVSEHVEKQALRRRNTELERRLDERYGFQGIIGKSPSMVRIFETLGQVSGTNATVLITGESGTGKELIAKAVHQNSRRKKGPFVALNCAALSEGVLESELFGHTKGAFTGALRSHQGKFEYASGGTLFLDEVGDMPLSIQAKLLRVIEEREIVRVGTNDPVKIDVRLLAATNQDLQALVTEKKFREDLYFRLNVVTIDLPPLRERVRDLPELARHIWEQNEAATSFRLTDTAIDVLAQYRWPGNVRELENAVTRLRILGHWESESSGLKVELPSAGSCDVPFAKVSDEELKQFIMANQPKPGVGPCCKSAFGEAIAEFLRRQKNNRTAAAEVLNVRRTRLVGWLKTYAHL